LALETRDGTISTLLVKKQDTLLMSIASRNINRFSNVFIHIPTHLKCIAALPYETIMFQKSHKFKSAVLVFINKILLKVIK